LILPNLAQTSKAYVDDFAKTLQAIDLLRQFTEENKERAALKQTLVDWLFTEINNAIGFIESPEDGALVSELLSGLKDSWIVKTGAAQYLGAMAALIAKLDAEMSRLRDEIIDVVPALRPITRNPNSLNIFRRPKSGANPIPGAVDTVEFLGQNRDAFDRVNAILAGEISGEKNKFKVLKQGGSHSVKSLYELIKDERGFFSGGNGVTMVLAVKTKKKKNFLYVSVTGRDRGSAWEFETELK
ncbi:MAG: hypothetical protein HQ564_09370, partial [Candidatus Saganbacteria bacterium]|nr:hypothetical protein [Candidatus Saganbacteria bacterium]